MVLARRHPFGCRPAVEGRHSRSIRGALVQALSCHAHTAGRAAEVGKGHNAAHPGERVLPAASRPSIPAHLDARRSPSRENTLHHLRQSNRLVQLSRDFLCRLLLCASRHRRASFAATTPPTPLQPPASCQRPLLTLPLPTPPFYLLPSIFFLLSSSFYLLPSILYLLPPPPTPDTDTPASPPTPDRRNRGSRGSFCPRAPSRGPRTGSCRRRARNRRLRT